MKPFLAALVVAAALGYAAHWYLTAQLGWTSAARFADQQSVRLDPAAATRGGF
ncbi:MAG: hypothetical protein K6T74_03600 [Geminicoccaceae bacterium]|nr:hypothetical protein [Geminicoccaceae bacterium]